MNKNSIVDYLKSQKQNSSYSSRKKLASENGIKNYTGTAAQNTKLLNVLKNTDTPKSVSFNRSPIKAKTGYTEDYKKGLYQTLGLSHIPSDKEVSALLKLETKIGSTLTKENIKKYYADSKNKKKDTLDNKGDTPDSNNIYDQRDEYLKNYIGAVGEQFDEKTLLQVNKLNQAKDDYNTDIEYYRQDYNKITSRKNQDYFKGIALQNKEFSKSLDYVANLGNKMVGALEGFGKSRIIEATDNKTESDIRYKLNYDRATADLAEGKQKAEARYKLNTDRLAESKADYEKSRATDKKVGAIEAAGSINRYYDNIITSQTLADDEAAKRRKDIQGGGTGVENIFSF